MHDGVHTRALEVGAPHEIEKHVTGIFNYFD